MSVDSSLPLRYRLLLIYSSDMFGLITLKKTLKAERSPNAAGYSEFRISVDGKTFGILFLSLSEAKDAALGLEAQGKKCEIFCLESRQVVMGFDRGKPAAVA
jgi:hypothetical protein